MKLGDKVFVMFDRGHGSRDGVYMFVRKLGREWVYIGVNETPHYRFKKTDPDMVLDGGNYSSPGRCYASREAYTAERDLRHTWDWFRNTVYNTMKAPDGVTREAISKVAISFGFKEGTEDQT